MSLAGKRQHTKKRASVKALLVSQPAVFGTGAKLVAQMSERDAKQGMTLMLGQHGEGKTSLAALLGLLAPHTAKEKKVIEVPSPTAFTMHSAIKKGLHVRQLGLLKKRLGLTDKQMADYLGTSPATLQRKRHKNAAIGAIESDRLYRLVRLVAQAEELFGDSTIASDWLKSPHPELDGEVPYELMETEVGARAVEDLLGQMADGSIC